MKREGERAKGIAGMDGAQARSFWQMQDCSQCMAPETCWIAGGQTFRAFPSQPCSVLELEDSWSALPSPVVIEGLCNWLLYGTRNKNTF